MTMPADERRRNDHISDADLNDLIDGTLTAQAAATARAHLATCADCEERFLTLQATVAALQHAPNLMPRRSFQLTPEQARIPPKAPTRLDRFAERIVPSLPVIRAATLAVALLLISVTAFDVLTNQSSSPEQAPIAQMRQSEQAVPAPPEVASDQAAAPAQTVATSAPELAESSGPLNGAPSASGPETGGVQSALGGADTGNAAENAAPAMAPEPTSAGVVAATEVLPATAGKAFVASPVTTPEASPSPVPSAVSETSSAGASISRWRIAELALLLLLIWLAVSWVGRLRVDDKPAPGDQ